MRVAVMISVLLGAGLAVADQSLAATPKSVNPSVVVRKPGYEASSIVERAIRRNGVQFYGKHHIVKQVDCQGIGAPRRRANGRLTELTYREFNCAISTRFDPLAHAKVIWWANNTYRYDFFGCKRDKGCA